MIEIKWGPLVEHYGNKHSKYSLYIARDGIQVRNFEKFYKRYFLKWNRKAFSICLPCKLYEAESIKWIFGWILHDKIDFCTDTPDPVLLELHFCKLEVALYR